MSSRRTGKANTARQRPAESWNRTEEPPTSTSSASRKPTGAGKHATAGRGVNGEDRPQRDGGTEKRVRSVQDETSTDKDGGRADQQGPRLRHRDRAVKMKFRIRPAAQDVAGNGTENYCFRRKIVIT